MLQRMTRYVEEYLYSISQTMKDVLSLGSDKEPVWKFTSDYIQCFTELIIFYL